MPLYNSIIPKSIKAVSFQLNELSEVYGYLFSFRPFQKSITQSASGPQREYDLIHGPGSPNELNDKGRGALTKAVPSCWGVRF